LTTKKIKQLFFFQRYHREIKSKNTTAEILRGVFIVYILSIDVRYFNEFQMPDASYVPRGRAVPGHRDKVAKSTLTLCRILYSKCLKGSSLEFLICLTGSKRPANGKYNNSNSKVERTK
jgi:hypothetical protein